MCQGLSATLFFLLPSDCAQPSIQRNFNTYGELLLRSLICLMDFGNLLAPLLYGDLEARTWFAPQAAVTATLCPSVSGEKGFAWTVLRSRRH